MAALSSRAILSLKFTAAGAGVGRSVGRFLRYVQHRDHGAAEERVGDVDGFLRYAAYRDRTSPRGRLFGREGDASESDRRELGRFITRSVAGLPEKSGGRPNRAFYRLVISPQDARGIDLRSVARAVIAQLTEDAGPAGLPPWIAAEHRNTAHAHVHVVLAARRQVAPGRYRTLVITRQRLQRMKEAMNREMLRQRGRDRHHPLERLIDRRRPRGHRLSARFGRVAMRLAAQYQREAERQAQRDRENGWER